MRPHLLCFNNMTCQSKLCPKTNAKHSVVPFDREEMAIDEAELQPRELAEKLHAQQILQEQVN